MSVLEKLNEVVLFDLEATCDDKTQVLNFDNETIEIGAVKIMNGQIVGEFQSFICPRDTEITAFCTELTSITKEDVENAPHFEEAIHAFSQFIGNAKILSWGNYDKKQLIKDSARHNLPEPIWIDRHINLKDEFASLMGVRRCGMKRALGHCNIPLEGTHHRGIDDARNIAKIYLHLEVNYFPKC